MKKFCIVIAILFLQKIIVSQSGFDYKIDTISIRNDSVFALIKTYNYDTLTSEMSGYINNEVVNFSSFRNILVLKHILKRNRNTIKVQIKGDYINYDKKGKQITTFYNGVASQSKYYNRDNKEVGVNDYFGGETIRVGGNFSGIIYLIK